jgi:hypothetical protein
MVEVAIPLGQAITQQSAAQLVMEYYARYRFHLICSSNQLNPANFADAIARLTGFIRQHPKFGNLITIK